jgi:hypothetical protein
LQKEGGAGSNSPRSRDSTFMFLGSVLSSIASMPKRKEREREREREIEREREREREISKPESVQVLLT